MWQGRRRQRAKKKHTRELLKRVQAEGMMAIRKRIQLAPNNDLSNIINGDVAIPRSASPAKKAPVRIKLSLLNKAPTIAVATPDDSESDNDESDSDESDSDDDESDSDEDESDSVEDEPDSDDDESDSNDDEPDSDHDESESDESQCMTR